MDKEGFNFFFFTYQESKVLIKWGENWKKEESKELGDQEVPNVVGWEMEK